MARSFPRGLAAFTLAVSVVLGAGAAGCARVPPYATSAHPAAPPTAAPGQQVSLPALPAPGIPGGIWTPNPPPTSPPPTSPAPTSPAPTTATPTTQTTEPPTNPAKPPANPAKPPKTTKPTRVNCAKVKCIALTFDDGPVPQTAHVLDVLKHHQAKATFFVLGELAATRPALLRRMVREGHAIGDHSWDHSQFWHQDAAAIRREVRRTAAAIRRATGSSPRMLRPPFGESNAVVRRIARQEGMAIVLWSVDPLDWRDRDTDTVIRRIVKRARPGAIILSHDIRPSTRRAIPEVIARLQAKGYVFVTVPELLGGRLRPGRTFSQR